MTIRIRFFIFLALAFLNSCQQKALNSATQAADSSTVIRPVVVTQAVRYDTDDPAFWIHPTDPSQSLILGTDKHADGALYVFGLDGKVDEKRTVRQLKRPNNVDVAYGIVLGSVTTDIAVVTEREAHQIRVFSLPDMKPLDKDGIPVFVADSLNEPMGVALYTRPADKAIFVLVGRKSGPTQGGYLWQYQLQDDGTGSVKANLVRKFGLYSGKKEIESIAVDNELGYVYYSDEGVGVRKYQANPDLHDDRELALFATSGFAEDHEGISIYKIQDGSGYILVSDQGADRFQIFRREGEPGAPHVHRLLKTIRVQAHASDGSEVTNVPLNASYPSGMFCAMSDNRTFECYSWEDLAGKELKKAPNGQIRQEPGNP